MTPSTPPPINKRCPCGNDYTPSFMDGECCPSCRPALLSKSWQGSVWACPDRYKAASYDDLRGVDKQLARAKSWAAMHQHTEAWLTIQGASGNGKTHLAAAVLRDAAERYCITSGWVNASEFGSEVMDLAFKGGVGTYIRKYTDPLLLVIDDLGVEGMQESVRVAMYRLINTRWEQRKRTIVTTNMSLEDIKIKIGQQVADRLLRTGRFIKFDGESYAWRILFEKQHGARLTATTPGVPARVEGNLHAVSGPAFSTTTQEKRDE